MHISGCYSPCLLMLHPLHCSSFTYPTLLVRGNDLPPRALGENGGHTPCDDDDGTGNGEGVDGLVQQEGFEDERCGVGLGFAMGGG